MTRVVLEGVTKRFGAEVAVNDLSLDIESGAFFSLLGPSGCGKTTTMRLIAGLDRPDEGRIWIGDDLVFDSDDNTFVPAGKRGLGMVFQNYALWPHMTVKENILFGLQVRKVARTEQLERLAEVQERLQISELGDRYPNELSGGQQQRIALARELVTRTPVLMMDEPLSNLDAKLRLEMRWELKRLHDELGATVIYVTHDQIEALTLSSEMAVMKGGVAVQVGTPDDVFRGPVNYFVAQFIGSASVNTLYGRLTKDALEGDGFRLPHPPELSGTEHTGEVMLAARPEELQLVDVEDEWCLPGRVESMLPMGHVGLVQIRLTGTKKPTLLSVHYDRRESEVRKGADVWLRFDKHRVHVFDAHSQRRITGSSSVTADEQAVGSS